MKYFFVIKIDEPAAPLESMDPPEDPPTTDPCTDLAAVLDEIKNTCRERNIDSNPVEILRAMQARLVVGRALDPTQLQTGQTNQLMIDRSRLLETTFDEIQALVEDEEVNKFRTLEINFYLELRIYMWPQSIRL